VEEIEMFDDILGGYEREEREERTPGVPEYEDPLNVLSLDDDEEWDAKEDQWNAGESWSSSDPDDVWKT